MRYLILLVYFIVCMIAGGVASNYIKEHVQLPANTVQEHPIDPLALHYGDCFESTAALFECINDVEAHPAHLTNAGLQVLMYNGTQLTFNVVPRQRMPGWPPVLTWCQVKDTST